MNKIYAGILSILLVLGFTVVGCDNPENTDGNNTDGNNTDKAENTFYLKLAGEWYSRSRYHNGEYSYYYGVGFSNNEMYTIMVIDYFNSRPTNIIRTNRIGIKVTENSIVRNDGETYSYTITNNYLSIKNYGGYYR
jgi:hypothetical protein